MPKKPATKEEIEAVRTRIIRETISLINEAGFSGFSMRRLGSRLGVAAKTIYNYFSDKDELYLNVLIKGFSLLHGSMAGDAANHKAPSAKLLAMAHAYVRFGLNNPNYYNVLFNLDLPRFKDYIGTRHESLADAQNSAALELAVAARAVIEKMVPGIDEKEIGYRLMQLWSTLHGIVSLNNSRVTLEVGELEKDIRRMVDEAVERACMD